MSTSEPMTGIEALKALIEGHAIRHRTWTAINRLERVWDPYLEDHLVVGRGTTIFVEDCRTGGATWILERLADPGHGWELWINEMEDQYREWCRMQGIEPA